MGVIHKIKPEVLEFILKKKKALPQISCRKLAVLVSEKFRIKLSKSSVNKIFKQKKLSMPVGRPNKPKRGVVEADGLGVFILKFADYLLGGTRYITEAIAENTGLKFSEDLVKETEFLLYRNILKDNPRGLSVLTGSTIGEEQISGYLEKINKTDDLLDLVLHNLSTLLKEVRGVKLDLPGGKHIYFDAQFRTIWLTSQVPNHFSSGVYNVKNRINNSLREKEPLVMNIAPGTDSPPVELFTFISFLSSEAGKNFKVHLYDVEFKDAENICLENIGQRSFVFALYSWQYVNFRKVNKMAEFKTYYYEPLQRDFFIAEAEIALFLTDSNNEVVLRGCAVKLGREEKIKMVILTNLSNDRISLENLFFTYLRHWPNFDEGIQDFNRKTEYLAYGSGYEDTFRLDRYLLEDVHARKDLEALLAKYLQMLDLYAKKYFLPYGYDDKYMQVLSERFYQLRAKIRKRGDLALLIFRPCQGYKYSKDLEYICARINEKAIVLEGKRFFCKLE